MTENRTHTDGVAPELRGREVSVRALIPPWNAACRRGVRPEELAARTGYSIEHLKNPRERMSWTSFSLILGRVGAVLDDRELLKVGASALESPVLRSLFVPGRLLFSLPDLYRWGCQPNGPFAQAFAVHEQRLTIVEERHLCIEATMKPGYAPVREHWLLTQGVLGAVSRAFGTKVAEVTLDLTPNGARYDIKLPPEKTTTLSKARRGASWLLAARETADGVKRANEELHARYLELSREVEARKRAEAELRELNEALEKRVAERTLALEAANRDLADANRELAMFSTSAAHDLRSPLRAINGFATALLEDHGDRLDPDAKAQIERVIGGAVRMATLIDALLALSRVTRTEVHRETVDLGEVARGVVEHLRTFEPSRPVEIEIAPDLTAVGDPALLRSAMQNLLGNAWKFTRDRAPAQIAVTRIGTAPGGVDVYRVRDNGVGFDMRHAQKLFEPFHRLHSARQFEGTGVGLATVERIVRRHGGRIWAEAAPNQGATFSFTLAPERES